MNDREWLETMWQDHAGKVYAYAARRVGREAADDVVADTFVVAWRTRTDRPSRELPWLYGVARRVIADRRRSGERFAGLIDRVAIHERPTTGDSTERVAALAALESLDEEDREVLLLSAWEGLGSADAARALGITAPSYRMRLSRARRRLTRALDDRGGTR